MAEVLHISHNRGTCGFPEYTLTLWYCVLSGIVCMSCKVPMPVL